MPDAGADFAVQIVGQDADADFKVAVEGAIDTTGGTDGDVVTLQADGSLALETPAGGGIAVEEDGTEEGTGIDRLNFGAGLDVAVVGSEATVTATALPTLHVRDEKAQNTQSGTFTAGAWQTRTLNTVKTNTISGASLASNQLQLPAGTYDAEWTAPALNVNRHQTRLYDTTGAAVLVLGGSEFADSANNGHTRSPGRGRFTLAAESVVELQHQCQTTAANQGFGIEANLTTEVYADLIITKAS